MWPNAIYKDRDGDHFLFLSEGDVWWLVVDELKGYPKLGLPYEEAKSLTREAHYRGSEFVLPLEVMF